ncbi:serine protease HTRA2, mitochondrial-like [Haliotis rubra]|uniref:serine protease HTRA2, mitochondrial-like n=1 Tax=Haliotis rubra TaxID=36100 RepID=UPI001EE5AE26|nr:serine protease HTRA2, mitochondrial-like [Haliotis rubra]
MALVSSLRRFCVHTAKDKCLLFSIRDRSLSRNGYLARFVAKNASSVNVKRNISKPLSILIGGSALCLSLSLYELLKDRLTPTVHAAVPDSPRMQYNFIADVVKKAAPAVVYIELKGRHPFHGGYTTMSNGSGFIVREDGLILTNAHVVGNKQSLRVKLHDGREFDGVVQAVDPVSDLATIKIQAKDLPTLQLGKSSSLEPGEWVIAMGSPLALSNTVTAGIVSTVHRGSKELGIHNKDMEYIQTDAVINFGNSGGPLVNLDGEAIGINTMKVTTGISFAIPSDYACEFLLKADELLKRAQSKSRGWFGTGSSAKARRFMGITMLTLTPSILLELKERSADFPDVQHGVFVHKVTLGSPAYNGGIHPGDVITQINGQDVLSSSDVYSAVENNHTLRVCVMRGARKILLVVHTEEVD